MGWVVIRESDSHRALWYVLVVGLAWGTTVSSQDVIK